ncbi:MAG: T9SS type A sorting domain-containing protein, partial [Ignavibacteria bacterium]|nr:T9SS type A sorting domain-containing protein [Ignavibacteria bacterium]
PNPFNPETSIGFHISVISHVTLKVYDLLGKEVTTLVDEMKQPGKYNVKFRFRQMQGNVEFNSSLPASVYFYRIQAGNFSETKKMILIK